ncbi:MAG: uroporphyrinogen decarboxylase family protein [Phycisphaerae bacterium]
MDKTRPVQMTDRQRFIAQMHCQPVDRCPIWDFGFFPATLEEWRRQGLPAGANTDELFGMDRQWDDLSPNVGLLPPFEYEVLEDRGDRELIRQEDGTVVVKLKHVVGMPQWVEFPIKCREDWRQFKRRLDPDTPGRIPFDWETQCRRHVERDYPLLLRAGSLYGWPRNWMGLETLSKLLYRDLTLFPEITETLAHLTITVLARALEQARRVGLTFDAAHMWEDMCYKNGPLLSPRMVREYMAPHYRAITRLLADYGIDIVILDSDGKIDDLIEIWLDCGVNCFFPIEVGTWNADPIELRRRFGRGLSMMGGFDKRILGAGPAAVDAEVDRLAPLAAEGGYIPFCDHRVPPDVPLRNYAHYLERAKQVFGRGVNVKPTWRPG